MPLTDDEIRAIINEYHPDSAMTELAARVLASEARVKVLEDALQKIGEAAFGHQNSKFVEIYIAARKALEPSLSPEDKPA